jgi:hypothetical protein
VKITAATRVEHAKTLQKKAPKTLKSLDAEIKPPLRFRNSKAGISPDRLAKR